MKLNAPFLHDRHVQRILTVIAAAGGEARFVGGCVRNALLHLPVTDIDLATTLPPAQTIAALTQAGIKTVPTGIAHGTVTAIVDGKPYEITTLRTDDKTDGRHADVSFTADWRRDAQRRDFTMNALYANAEGRISDFFDGITDAKARYVRFVGDPITRIQEDYLRILRFYRFYAQYGAGTLDADARIACHDLAPGLKLLSAERIAQEIIKLLSAVNYVQAATLMTRDGVLDERLPQLKDDKRLTHYAAREKIHYTGSWQARLVAWCGGNFKAAFDVAYSLKFSNTVKDYLKNMAAVYSALDNKSVPELLYRYSMSMVKDALLLNQKCDIAAALPVIETWQAPVFPLSGQDLLNVGFTAGPQLGAILKQTENWWIANSFSNNKNECLTFAKSLNR